ncbi:uncharacterized protein L969DRAFT_47163 [Mixia osmundae IAM 14324]|uniref:Macrofage activating glycoprotein n=1 Tax=Mixia osmundae (strain CBS 9802 / IAM 14324 / JCM 22182 / KY 12970) TaxID=764103 RepID=G7DWC2_MIXOS|nr:uncharacterized protein L969DRAFT_47163 [Mixia osmundae IAM 14324]KEI40371.1 hypothetical protein L969DRAFT_47163 [Mixia osmundae IAM 14324]GAA94882.1 hypothetical protein E5Q_01537 [Mixia osmundae IAM 14324]
MKSATSALTVLAFAGFSLAQTPTTDAAALSAAASAEAASGTILVEKRFTYPGGVPYRVDVSNGPRGLQTGYNLCNSTTEGPTSLCQTAFLSSIEDFCLWGPQEPNSIVGDTEGEMVAWCTRPGKGTRLIPEGTIRGMQFITTPGYVQITGTLDQSRINIATGDYGGELDSAGADQRGNPLGGLLFTQAFSNTSDLTESTPYTQVIRWHLFLGNDHFCLKACRPGGDDYRLCEHIYDRIGARYNCLAETPEDYFETCQGENQEYPGVYTSDGQVYTYTQPPESLGPITSIPYTPVLPASSNCVTMTSSLIFTAAAAIASSASASSASRASVASASSASLASVAAGTASTSPNAAATSVPTGAPASTATAVSDNSVSGATHDHQDPIIIFASATFLLSMITLVL